MEHQQLDEQPHRHYDSVIKFTSWGVAALTAAVCIFAFFHLISQPEAEELARRRGPSRSPLSGLILMPAGGYLLGMAIAVLFAPASYLSSKQGKKWMKMVGVKTVGSTRIVTLIFSLLAIAFLTFFMLALLTDDFKQSLF